MERFNYNQKTMNEKKPDGLGPSGRWLMFGGIPVAILGVLLTLTESHGIDGLAHNVGEKALPNVLVYVPLAIVLGGWVLYKYFPKRLVIPFGMARWIIGFSLIYWHYWFGPGSFGH
jgi:hypothetical protein